MLLVTVSVLRVCLLVKATYFSYVGVGVVVVVVVLVVVVVVVVVVMIILVSAHFVIENIVSSLLVISCSEYCYYKY